MKEKSIFIIIVISLVLIVGGGILALKNGIFSFSKNQNSSITSQQPQNTFPDKNPLFSFNLTSKKTTASTQNLHQQAISIYLIGDDKKQPIFQRNYYADGFNGNELTYQLAKNADSFFQNGTLGTLGCTSPDCSLPWNNFYIWNTKANKFILDNGAQRDVFTKLLIKYNTIDKKGCSLFSENTLPNQQGLSFSKLYQQYPTYSSYCNTTHGLNSKNLVFFLQAEKVLGKIITGENLSSNDIKDTSL